MLIPEVPIANFIGLNPEQLAALKSCAVTSGGELLFFAIIPPKGGGMTITDYVKTQAEYMAYNANSVGGKTLEEVTGTVQAAPVVEPAPAVNVAAAGPLACPTCGKVCKSQIGLRGHMKSHAAL